MWAKWAKEWDEYFSHSNIKCYEYEWTEQEEDEEPLILVQRFIEELANKERFYLFTNGFEIFPMLSGFRISDEYWERTKDRKIINLIKAQENDTSNIHTYGICEVTDEFIKCDARNWLYSNQSESFLLMTVENRPLEELMVYYESGFRETYRVAKRKEPNAFKTKGDPSWYIRTFLHDVNFYKLIEAEVERGGIVVMSWFEAYSGSHRFSLFMRSDYKTSLDNV